MRYSNEHKSVLSGAQERLPIHLLFCSRKAMS